MGTTALWSTVIELCMEIRRLGGTAYVVGGAARDLFIAEQSGIPVDLKDVDIEVFGIEPNFLEAVLSQRWRIDVVGKAFGIIKLHGLPIDVSVPRRERKTGVGHSDFAIDADPTMTVEEAAARRDFTINAISFDPLNERWVDPYNGRQAILDKVLDPVTDRFKEDSLRVLRGMQFIARFDLTPTPRCLEMCRELSQDNLPKERLFEEWKKLLLRGKAIRKALYFLRDIGWLERFYPELFALVGSPHYHKWHPEGWALKRTPSALPLAGTTQSYGRQLGFLPPGELIDGALATKAAQESTSSTIGAETIVSLSPNGLGTTADAGSLRLFLSTLFTPAVFAQAKSFVWSLAGATTPARKGSRVVFEITKPCVEGIMATAVNDFQIAQSIVGFVAVYVMDMLFPAEFSAQVKFHDQTVHANAFLSWPADIGVTVMGIDSCRYPIDGKVLCFFEFGAIGDAQLVHMPNSIASTQQYQVRIGDVFEHTALVVEAFTRGSFTDDEEKLVLGLAALCHDLGKPETAVFGPTKKNLEPHWTNHNHEHHTGPAERFLARLTNETKLVEKVLAICRAHMTPSSFYRNGADLPAFRRLALRVPIPQLVKMLRFDQGGRGPTMPPDEQMIAWFEGEAARAGVQHEKPKPVVLGRDLIERFKYPSGPKMGQLLGTLMEKQLAGEFATKEDGLAIAAQLIHETPRISYEEKEFSSPLDGNTRYRVKEVRVIEPEKK